MVAKAYKLAFVIQCYLMYQFLANKLCASLTFCCHGYKYVLHKEMINILNKHSLVCLFFYSFSKWMDCYTKLTVILKHQCWQYWEKKQSYSRLHPLTTLPSTRRYCPLTSQLYYVLLVSQNCNWYIS